MHPVEANCVASDGGDKKLIVEISVKFKLSERRWTGLFPTV